MNSIQWSVGGELPPDPAGKPAIGLAGPVTGVHNGVLLVAGGANFPEGMPWDGGKKAYPKDGFVFRREASGNLSLRSRFQLSQAVAYPAVCSSPKGVIAAGGENETGLLSSVFLYSWGESKGSVVATPLPGLPQPLTAAAAVVHGNTVYLAGGQSPAGTSDAFYALDLDRPTAGWTALPPIPKPASHAVFAVQNNGERPCLYLMGGRKANEGSISDIHSSVYSFDLKTKSWSERSPLPFPLSAGTGTGYGASFILLFSGDKGEVFSESERLIAAINQETDTLQQAQLKAQRKALMETHPGFNRTVLLYNTVTDAWTARGTLPFDGQVTTSAVKWEDEVYIPSGEIRAGVRTPEIRRGKVDSPKFFSWLDYGVLIVYLLLMVGIGVWASSRQVSTNDYFKGGQRIPGWAAGLSIYSTQLSAITFMSIPAKTYATNWNYFFLQMTIILIIPIIARYFIPFFRRLDITSAYEYLEKRFDYAIRAIASLLFVFLQVGRLSIVLLLPSLALTLVTGVDVMLCILLMGLITIFYTMKGGIEAVIWTDVTQAIILLGGALVCVALMLFQIGQSPAEIWATLHQNQKLDIFDFRLTIKEPTLWVVLIGGIAINVISYGADQTVVQRYLTTKNEAAARKSLKLGAWMALPSALIFFSIGTLLYLFFRQFPEKANFSLQSQDAIFPWYIVSNLPPGIIGLLIAAIFAAAMSTLSSSMNSITTALTTDFYRKFNPHKTELAYLRLARWITLGVGIIGTGFALIMSQSGISSLWDQFNTILGLFTGGLGGLFVLGIFTRKANATGALAGILVSGVVQYFVKNFTDINLLMYAFTGLVSCVVFGYAFSLLFAGGKKQTDGLTIYSQPV
ncbi:MAG: sodium/solute symporter [Haliscomenobacter sp.]|nr:sodium/solute symporter [Haliscomenobacter sp.]